MWDFSKKKGQITIFIILGIVILMSSAVFFYIKGNLATGEDNLEIKANQIMSEKLSIDTIKTYIESLINLKLQEGLRLSALNGARLYGNENSILNEYGKISYFKNHGTYTIPTEELIENDLLKFIEDEVKEEILNMHIFEERGYTFNFSDNVKGNLNFNQNEIYLDLDWDILIKKESSRVTNRFNRFVVKIESRYYRLYKIAQEITSSYEYTLIPFTSQLTDSYISIQAFPYDDDETIYTITDKLSNPEIIFMFGLKEKLNSKPKLEFIPNFKLNVGQSFNYFVSALDPDGDSLSFSIDNEYILIDPITGFIVFTPQVAGKFTSIITVRDEYGLEDTQKVIFEIDHFDIDERIVTDNFNSITVESKDNFSYNFPVFSTTGELLTCLSSNSLIKFDKDCIITLNSTNINLDMINTTVTISDESGYVKITNFTIYFVDSINFIIDPISNILVYQGQNKQYQVNVISHNSDLIFNYDIIPKTFPINQSGVINITAYTKGTYFTTVKVKDQYDNEQERDFNILIK